MYIDGQFFSSHPIECIKIKTYHDVMEIMRLNGFVRHTHHGQITCEALAMLFSEKMIKFIKSSTKTIRA